MAFSAPAILSITAVPCAFTPALSHRPARLPSTTATRPRAAHLRATLPSPPTTPSIRPTSAGPFDLTVVGAGGLGVRAAREWRLRYPSASVTCVTWSDERHASLLAEGFTPALSSALSSLPRTPFVLCSAPPSARQSVAAYCADVRAAAALATRRFVFTSATSVYDDRGLVREDSPLALTPRARRMRAAEDAVHSVISGAADVSAAVVRLGLLYDAHRGAHAAFLHAGRAHGGPHSVYNVVHYDDAAAAAVAALRARPDVGSTFIVVDGRPVTSSQMVRAARAHPLYNTFGAVRWGDGGFAKIVDGSWSQHALQWQPRWPSFERFMLADAERSRQDDDSLVHSTD